MAGALSEMFSYGDGAKHAASRWIVCWAAMGALAIWLLTKRIRWWVREVRELVGSPRSIYAFMIAPDGTDFLAKQK